MNDLKEAVANIGMPGILKPVGASGSKGIFKIESKAHLEDTFNLLLILPPQIKIRFIVTTLICIFMKNTLKEKSSLSKVLCKNKEVFIAGITDKRVTPKFSLEYIAFSLLISLKR